MRNIAMVIEYLGTNYAGFQRQPNQRTIQGVIEEALFTILREDISIIAAGRTDAGVHAYGQVVNFRTNAPTELGKLRWSLNCILPKDIAIKNIFTVPEAFNARREAIAREYIYQILNRSYRSAFLGEISFFYPWHLNVTEMERAARRLMGTHDFSSFARLDKNVQVHKVKTISTLEITNKESLLTITVKADSFLHNMVRIIVGTLLEVGSGNIKSKKMDDIVKNKDRSLAGETAPPQGLILKAVTYPEYVSVPD